MQKYYMLGREQTDIITKGIYFFYFTFNRSLHRNTGFNVQTLMSKEQLSLQMRNSAYLNHNFTSTSYQ